MGRIVSLPRRRADDDEDYEAALAPIYAWIHAVAQRVGPGVGRTLHGSSVRGWQALRSRGLAPARGGGCLPGARVRAQPGRDRPAERRPVAAVRCARRGCSASTRLRGGCGLRSRYVVFGHTHRAGPLPGDDLARVAHGRGWRADQQRLLGTRAGFLAKDAPVPGRVRRRPSTTRGPPALVNLPLSASGAGSMPGREADRVAASRRLRP